MSEIINHLWQSTILTAVAAALSLTLRNHHASTRYWIWLAASLKFLFPLSLLVMFGTRVDAPPSLATIVPPESVVPVIVNSFAPAAPVHASTDWLPVLAIVWLLGSAILIARWIRNWLRLRATLRGAAHFSTGLPVTALSAPSAIEPGVFGILRPVIVLPEDIASNLDASELDAILMHEMNHILRRDNLTAALHMVVETLFWFHPLVWWIGSKLVEERENACDEAVLAAGRRPKVYAQGIVRVCRHYVDSPLACASGVSGGHLPRRIRAIMMNRESISLTPSRKLVLSLLGIAIAAMPVLIGIVNIPSVRAQTSSKGLTFEVASIKPSNPDSRGMSFQITPGGGLRAVGVTVRMLVHFAYGVDDSQVSGGPGWMRDERFDIIAKPANPEAADAELPKDATETQQRTQADRLRERIRALLSERFQLTVRVEPNERPVYLLVQAKGGHKLKASTGSGGVSRNRGMINGSGANLSVLTQVLPGVLGRPVLDRTGLTDRFDFRLEWAEDPNPMGKGGGPDTPPASEGTGGPTIFTAIQEQLGLRLEAAKGPVDVVVIERLEKPTAN